MPAISRITPCLWFDDQAEEAVTFYTGIFRNSRVISVSRYGKAGQEIHGKTEGSVMTMMFELEGQTFTALNGGPRFKFTEALSLQILCDTQDEVDHYWNTLSEGSDPNAQQCGWLKDRYGVSWQIVPTMLVDLLANPDTYASQKAMAAVLGMKKIDIETIKRACAG
jgi:predicted 3-demethylubiquinone-9 3-methyltransferase (glyoxalase superfamily)